MQSSSGCGCNSHSVPLEDQESARPGTHSILLALAIGLTIASHWLSLLCSHWLSLALTGSHYRLSLLALIGSHWLSSLARVGSHWLSSALLVGSHCWLSIGTHWLQLLVGSHYWLSLALIGSHYWPSVLALTDPHYWLSLSLLALIGSHWLSLLALMIGSYRLSLLALIVIIGSYWLSLLALIVGSHRHSQHPPSAWYAAGANLNYMLICRPLGASSRHRRGGDREMRVRAEGVAKAWLRGDRRRDALSWLSPSPPPSPYTLLLTHSLLSYVHISLHTHNHTLTHTPYHLYLLL